MKKISYHHIGLPTCRSVRLNFDLAIRAILISFLVISVGLVEAGDFESVRVIELHLSSASPQLPGDPTLAPAPPPIDSAATVLSDKRSLGVLPRQRNPELSPQHLVVVCLSIEGEEISSTIMLDPRLIRGETAESSGQLSSSDFFHFIDVTFSVTIPDDSNAKVLKIYKPRWTGENFTLDLVNTVFL